MAWIQDRRRGDRRNRLLFAAALLALSYFGLFVWPTPWRYDRVGHTPVRTNRVTDHVEFLNLQGWQPALPPLNVHQALRATTAPVSRDPLPPSPTPAKGQDPGLTGDNGELKTAN